MSADFELVGIGNALVDLFATIQTPLEKPPSAQGRHIAADQLAKLIRGLPHPTLCAGGGAANTVKLAAQLGITSAFIGSVGRDPWGEQFARELEAAGAAALLVKTSSPTGACVILRDGSSLPQIFASPSAALELGPEHIPEDIIRQTRLIMLDGYVLGRTHLVDHILNLAERFGTFIAIDVGSVEMVQAHANQLEAYCRTKPLILFLNEAEAGAFCKHLDPHRGFLNEADIEEEDRYLPLGNLTKQDIFPIVVVKLGDRGARVFANGEAYTARTQVMVPFDVTGAGDAFAAAFIAAWLRNRSLSECAEMGNRLAREIIRISGTRLETKKLTSIRRLLSSSL